MLSCDKNEIISNFDKNSVPSMIVSFFSKFGQIIFLQLQKFFQKVRKFYKLRQVLQCDSYFQVRQYNE